MSTDTIERVEVDKTAGQVDLDVLMYEQVYDQDMHDRFTHIVNPPNNLHIWREGMSAQDVVDIARINGWPIKMLCGFVLIPKFNPDKYPACPTCMDIAHQLISENE